MKLGSSVDEMYLLFTGYGESICYGCLPGVFDVLTRCDRSAIVFFFFFAMCAWVLFALIHSSLRDARDVHAIITH